MKKFLATLLTVTMLGSVSVPALAAEQPADTSGSANTTYPADEANTPYDQGYDDGYKLGYEKGEALCKQDIANGTVTYSPDYNYSEGSETYEDGLTDGTIDGMDDGYTATFEYHYHMDYWTAVELLDKGGTVGQINVLVNELCLHFENGPWPVLFQGTTMVPVRTVMEALGANVAYAQTAKTITVTKGDTVVTLTLGSPRPPSRRTARRRPPPSPRPPTSPRPTACTAPWSPSASSARPGAPPSCGMMTTAPWSWPTPPVSSPRWTRTSPFSTRFYRPSSRPSRAKSSSRPCRPPAS